MGQKIGDVGRSLSLSMQCKGMKSSDSDLFFNYGPKLALIHSASSICAAIRHVRLHSLVDTRSNMKTSPL
jgi:hypothetical protein